MLHEFASMLANSGEKQLSSLFHKITENNSLCLYPALLQERDGGSPEDNDGKFGNIVTSLENGGSLAAWLLLSLTSLHLALWASGDCITSVLRYQSAA